MAKRMDFGYPHPPAAAGPPSPRGRGPIFWVSVAFEPFGPVGADLVVRPLQGRVNRWAHYPWASGTKGVPLPTATQFKPLRGSEPFPGLSHPRCPAEDMGKDQPRGRGCFFELIARLVQERDMQRRAPTGRGLFFLMIAALLPEKA